MLWINRNGFHMPAIKQRKRGEGGRKMRGSGWALLPHIQRAGQPRLALRPGKVALDKKA